MATDHHIKHCNLTTLQYTTSHYREGHSEMKILSIMRFHLLIMPIVLIFFQPLYLSGQKGYGKMMQVLNQSLFWPIPGLQKRYDLPNTQNGN